MRAVPSLLRSVPALGLAVGLGACGTFGEPRTSPVPIETGYRTPVDMPPAWSPPVYAPRVYSRPPDEVPVPDDLPVYVPPPRPVELSGSPRVLESVPVARSRDPDPVSVPVAEKAPGVPPDSSCGWWRLCNLPGWRYEN